MPCNLISSCFFPESPWFREIDCAGPGQPQHQDWQLTNQPGELHVMSASIQYIHSVVHLSSHSVYLERFRASSEKRMKPHILEFAVQSAQADKTSNQSDLMFLFNSQRRQYRIIKTNFSKCLHYSLLMQQT